MDPRDAFSGYNASYSSTLGHGQYLDGTGNLHASVGGKNDIVPLRYGDYGLATSGIDARSFTPLEDPALLRCDVAHHANPNASYYEHPDPLQKPEALLGDESHILFVDNLPKDCTRREVGHLFRPFIGFKEIRVIHKEARKSGDKAYVLCFVEFSDPKCALTAMEALQGYKFDDKKPDSPALKIQFAKFPFRPASHAH